MRPSPITLASLLLLPAPAFACVWKTVAVAPQHFLWWSVPLFTLAGFGLRMKFDDRKSLLPVAVAIACAICSAALGESLGYGRWAVGTAPLALLALSVPLGAVYLIRHKTVLTVAMAVVFAVSALVADSKTTHTPGYNHVRTEVVF